MVNTVDQNLKIRACVLNRFSHIWLCNPMDWAYSPGKNTGVGCHALPQGIFQGLTLCLSCLLHWQVCSLPLAPPEKPQTKYGINQSNLAEYLKLIFFVAYSTNVCYIKKCINKVHTINRSSKKKQLNL